MQIRVCVCVCVCVLVCVHANMCEFYTAAGVLQQTNFSYGGLIKLYCILCVFVYIRVCVCVCLCVCMHVCVFIRVYICI